MKKDKKLLLIGGSKGNVHLHNFHELIKPYFSEIHIVSAEEWNGQFGEIVHFGLKNPIAMIQNIYKLKGIIKRINPDLIHVHQANAYGFLTCLANRRKKPLVLTTWGSDVLTLPHKSFLHRWMVKYILKSANYITADAQYMADAVQELIGPKPVVVANFGVELTTEKQEVIRENVIYSNRMHEPLYQIDQIIKQCGPFLIEHPEWKLRIAASGSETVKLQEIANEILPAESYEFVGFQSGDENRKNYLKARIYISIPNTDGTSISLLESLAYGCIPIVSDLPANREWIAHGINGLITSGNLQVDLNEALRMNERSLREYNEKLIHERATKEANRKKYVEIYDRIFE